MIKHELLKVSDLQGFAIREIRENVIEQLRERVKERGYNQAKCLTVVKKDGVFFVADGNHRLKVLKENNIEYAPCVVYEDEAGADIYNLAVQANIDEDTYAPMDLFDWLECIGKLKGEGFTQQQIGEKIGWSLDAVKKHSVLLSKVPTILELCKEYQKGRGTDLVPNGTFDFTEGWFRLSGLYDLAIEQQQAVINECIAVSAFDKVKKITDTYKNYNEMICYVNDSLLDLNSKESLTQDIYNGIYKNLKQIRATVTNLNKAWIDKNNIRILHGDAFELVNTVQDSSIDLVLTDLPYNCSKENNFDSMGRQGIDFGEWDKIEDYDKFLKNTVSEISRTLKNGGSFYMFANIINVSDLWRILEGNGLTPKRVMVWEKSNPIPTNQDRLFLASSEMFIWGTKGDDWIFNSSHESNVIKCATETANRIHTTQKPIELFEKLINISSNPGSLVMDMFSGSGTTAICCKKLKRRFIGFEADEVYYKKSLARLAGD
jgi:site-specific DNA-methyltransferase (adenine-specific)